MTKLNILTVPNPRLRIKAKEVCVFDQKLKNIVNDMFETMQDHLGLAATQVDIPLRIFVFNTPNNLDVNGDVINDIEYIEEKLCIINPVIIKKNTNTAICNEGCLSVPDTRIQVKRPSSVVLKYQDVNANFIEREFFNLQAICVQHEIDHLDGKLMLDYVSSLKRELIIKKIKKDKSYA